MVNKDEYIYKDEYINTLTYLYHTKSRVTELPGNSPRHIATIGLQYNYFRISASNRWEFLDAPAGAAW